MSVAVELQAARVAALLHTQRYGRSLEMLDCTDSTNDAARRAALAGAVMGHTVVANRQLAGRGSQGRSWSSPGGLDLYVSIVDRPGLNGAALPPLTLAVGLGVAETVDEVLGSGARSAVKWPNDVWVDHKKCAGILVEASSVGDHLQSLVIGIGLNVNRVSFEDELAATATSLHALSPAQAPLDRAVVLAELLMRVEHWVDRLSVEGAGCVAAALDARLALRGEPVQCGELRGELLGVAQSGALRIATAHGVREAYSGRLERLAER